MLIRLFQQFGFGFGVDMLEGFGMVKFFLGMLKGGGELGKIIGKVLDFTAIPSQYFLSKYILA